jgi:hypothetical protein
MNQAQQTIHQLRNTDVLVVHMRDGGVKVMKNRFGISGNIIPSKQQWERQLGTLRETHGDFRLWEMDHFEADVTLKGRMNW